jgi:hypothetical protein
MQILFLSASVLHAIFAVTLVSVADPPELTLTARKQFDGWTPLLDSFRVATFGDKEGTRARALSLSWCNATLPPNTTRAPYCACVSRASDKFSNASQKASPDLQSARDAAVVDLVACLDNRPVWRVWPVWSVRFSTPAVFALFVAASFLWVAADVPWRLSTAPVWLLATTLVVVLVVHDYLHNIMWSFMFLLVAILIDWIIVPGMAKLSRRPGDAADPAERAPLTAPEKEKEQLPTAGTPSPANAERTVHLNRTPSCFWWCEYLSAPVFAVYVPLLHCGRDFVFTIIFTMIGTAVGGLGLRSFWCSQAYTEAPKSQFMSVMQDIVWLGILASTSSLCLLTGIYYSDDVPYKMGPGSVALLGLTFAISLLQWPGNQDFHQLLFTQMLLALARNITLFGLMVADLFP